MLRLFSLDLNLEPPLEDQHQSFPNFERSLHTQPSYNVGVIILDPLRLLWHLLALQVPLGRARINANF